MITKPVVPVNSLGLTIIDLRVQSLLSSPPPSLLHKVGDIKHIICTRHQVHRLVLGSKACPYLKINPHITQIWRNKLE